jgi:ankyrin repeat protein
MPIEPMKALSAAVRANNTAQVSEVLANYPELKMKLDDPLPGAPFGGTALLAAVAHGNREMVDVLLRAGANINARSHWWAGSFGVLDHDGALASFLIDRGATVDAHAAARLGMIDRLGALVSANPDVVHARGGDGQTPLHFAASVAVAEYLLDHGADIDARDVDHESTPAQWMVRDRQDVARALVRRGCGTDILMAAALGDLELVRRHLDADPSCISMSVSEEFFPKQDPRSGGCIYIWTIGANKTAHLIARELGHDAVFELLRERTAPGLALAIACTIGDEDMTHALLRAHPNLVDSLGDRERRQLAVAAQDNDLAAVRRMLAANWPVDGRGQHGGTPLHWAAWNGNTEMVRELLKHRPSLEITDEAFNGTPLGWAIYGSVHGWRCKDGDYAGTVDALLQAGANPPANIDDLDASEAVRDVLRRGRQ